MLSSRSRAALLEPPGGTEGLGAREQQLDPLPGWRAVGHQAQRGAEPTRGARGRTQRGRLSGLAQDRSAAASPWRAACSTWCARAGAEAPRSASASAQRSCAPSSQPPGALS